MRAAVEAHGGLQAVGKAAVGEEGQAPAHAEADDAVGIFLHAPDWLVEPVEALAHFLHQDLVLQARELAEDLLHVRAVGDDVAVEVIRGQRHETRCGEPLAGTLDVAGDTEGFHDHYHGGEGALALRAFHVAFQANCDLYVVLRVHQMSLGYL